MFQQLMCSSSKGLRLELLRLKDNKAADEGDATL
jgi:hypothetical protein